VWRFLPPLLDPPAEIRNAVRNSTPDTGELHVVNEDDTVLLDQTPREVEVEEDGLEPVIAGQEGEVELPVLSEQARKDDL
jgi:hypothetical protein